MKNQIVYVLIHPSGEPNFGHCSYYRKSVEVSWLKVWGDPKLKKWSNWYNRGWRIKKVELTIEVL